MTGHRGAALERLHVVLEQHGCRRASPTMWQCPAPPEVHNDQTASLSVDQGNVGAVVCCQAGCDTGQVILPALGLAWADLFDEPRLVRDKSPSRVVAEYRYTDERGRQLLFVKERLAPKSFRVRRPDGCGDWIWGLGPETRRVLYRLPRIVAAKPSDLIWIVEGEKDVHALEARGQVATTNFDGASKSGDRPKWRAEYSPFMVGHDVRVVADRDEEGRAHAEYLELCLRGIARTLEVVEAAQGKDAADHFGAGLGIDDFVRWTR